LLFQLKTLQECQFKQEMNFENMTKRQNRFFCLGLTLITGLLISVLLFNFPYIALNPYTLSFVTIPIQHISANTYYYHNQLVKLPNYFLMNNYNLLFNKNVSLNDIPVSLSTFGG